MSQSGVLWFSSRFLISVENSSMLVVVDLGSAELWVRTLSRDMFSYKRCLGDLVAIFASVN